MNIDDVPTEKLVIPEDIWAAIWNHQKELHNTYKEIEVRNGIGYPGDNYLPFNIDDQYWQYYVKDLMWRVTEELAEAEECWADVNHHHEEIIDALHFLVELNIVLNVSPGQIKAEYEKGPKNLTGEAFDVIYHLGLAANTLKNKPWKNDFKATDLAVFYDKILQANVAMWWILHQGLRLNLEEVYVLYFKKMSVNRFRIRSKY